MSGQHISTTPRNPAPAQILEGRTARLAGRLLGGGRVEGCFVAALFVAVALGASSSAGAEDPPGALSTPLQQSDSPDAPGQGNFNTTLPNGRADPGEPRSTPETASPLHEQMPPIGRGKLLSGAQLRYCLAQSIRIDAVRTVLNRSQSADVEYFNRLVTDFNKRCASYRYELNTLAEARRDVDDHRPQLEKAARETYAKRFASRRQEPTRATPGVTAQPQVQKEAQTASAQRTETRPAARARPVEPPQPPQETRPEMPIPAAPPQPPPVAQHSQPASAPTAAPERGSAEQPVAGPPSPKPEAPTPKPDAPAPALSSQARSPEGPQPPAAPAAERRPAASDQPWGGPQPAHVTQQSQPTSVPVAPPDRVPGSESIAIAPPTPQPTAPVLTPPAQAPKEAQPPSPPVAERRPVAAAQPSASPPPPASKATSTAESGGSANEGDAALKRFTREIQEAGSLVVPETDYPEQALGKRWEGTTQIEVRFDAGGYIRSIVLGESSGHPLLDEKALDLARNATFPDVPKELHSREFTVRFPIVFRLGKS